MSFAFTEGASWSGRWARLAVVALLLGASGAGRPAHAIALYFNGPESGGLRDGVALSDPGPLPDVGDAVSAGVSILDPDATFAATGLVSIVTPDPITAETSRPPSPSPSHPVTGTTTWQVTNETDDAFVNLWLVFVGKSGSDPNGYLDENVGLDVAPFAGGSLVPGESQALLHVTAGGDEFWYPAVFLGRLEPGQTVPALVRYRVAQDPFLPGEDYTFPALTVGLATAIPEPASALLVGLGLVVVAAGRRGRRP